MPIIYCSFADIPADLIPEGFLLTESALTCFFWAETTNPEAIIVVFPFASLELNNKRLELISCLKHDPRTRKIPLYVRLFAPRKALINELCLQKIDGILPLNWLSEDPGSLTEYLQDPDAILTPSDMADAVCPFLNSEVYNETEEILLCGADRNRLVINTNRLQRLCSTREHHTCRFFHNPNFTSGSHFINPGKSRLNR